MKPIGLKITVQATASLAVFCAVLALAGSAGAVDRQYCSWCHGETGQGYASAPRLAGQRSQYIEKQLQSFQDRTRAGQLMRDAAADLTVQSARDIALYFSAIPPDAANDGEAALAPTGRTIYRDGIPDSDIVACAACHGPNAQGVGEIPRLGGLSYYYLQMRLAQWREGHNTTAPPPMPRVASQLSPNEIKALASYLSSVK